MKILLFWCFLGLHLININSVQGLYGRNVCRKTVRQPYYTMIRRFRTEYTSTSYDCKLFGWWTCHKSKSKSVSYQQRVVRYRVINQYYCCSGWKQQGNSCPTPICNPVCQYGKCTNPNTCTCHPGFEGRLCDKEINECKNNPCDHNCVNTFGSYYCTCRPGYKKINNNPTSRQCINVNECATSPCQCAQPGTLENPCLANCTDVQGRFYCSCNSGYQLKTDDSTTCTDIDECQSQSLNHCKHNCLNTIGSYKCSCRKGYLLDSNGRNCTDIDECATLNGGCSQNCKNKPGFYQCYCRRGFRLRADGKTCEDINECNEQNQCDNVYGICQNTIGSYRCSCVRGYKLLPDKKKCTDVNECLNQDTNGCQHNCTNTQGSYKCSCVNGFRLAADNKRCDDINECKEIDGLCDHICINRVGSYKCKCKDGYGLEDDKHGCEAFPCQTIVLPMNGNITCSGYVTDDSCQYHCIKGFDLIGPNERTCLPTSQWSGMDPVCQRKTCPAFDPPTHGSVLLPCLAEYGFECFKKCSKGYYVEGSDKSKCIFKKNQTIWTGQDTQCKAATFCKPNPCQNGGRCTVVKGNSFKCDCRSTLFDGKLCEVNKVIIPDYPQLVVNKPSIELEIFVKPTIFVRVELIASANENSVLVFTPPVLEIYYPDDSAKFTVTATAAGIYDVEYGVRGSVGVFIQPKPSRIYAFNEKTSLLVDYGINSLKEEYDRSVFDDLILTSTCNFTKDSGSCGFVFLEGKNIHVPLSITGVTEKHLKSFANQQIIDTTEEISMYLQHRNIVECVASCYGPNGISQSQRIQYVLENGLFPMAFFKQMSVRLPFWLEITPSLNQPTYNVQNLITKVFPGALFKKHQCYQILSTFPTVVRELIIESHTYAAYHTNLPTMMKSMANIFHTKQLTKTCYVYDITSGNLFIASDSSFNIIDEASPNHIITKLTSNFVSFDRNNQSSMLLDIQLKMHSFDGIFKFKSLVKMKDFEKLLLDKFTSSNIGQGSGALDYKIMFDFMGKKLIFEGKNILSEQILSYEGNKRASLDVGILGDGKIRFESAAIRFQPTGNLNFTIPLQASGGKMIRISNKAFLRTSLHSLIRSKTKSEDILKELFAVDSKLKDIFSKQATRLFITLESAYKQLTGQNDEVVYKILRRKIEEVKYTYADLVSFIKLLLNEYQNVPARKIVVKKLQTFLRRLKRIEDMKVVPEFSTFTLKDIKGLTIRYNGSLCIYNLCFPELQNVQIIESPSQDSLTINASCKYFKASHRLVFHQNDSVSIKINKYSEQFSGEFSVTIYLLDRYYPVVINFDEDSFRYQFFVELLGGISFQISNTGNLPTASWKDIIKAINGYSKDVSQIHDMVVSKFKEISTNTANRIDLLKKRDNETTENHQSSVKEVNKVRMQDQKASVKFRKTQSDYNVLLTKLQSERARYQSMINNNQTLFLIDRDVTKVCTLWKCPTTCIPMTTCKVCQEKVKVPSKRWNCQTFTENIRSSQLVEVEQTCEETKYTFKTIYTGTCEEDPNDQRRREAQNKKALTLIGTGIGSFFPPFGGIIGSFIGGFLSSIFNSCERTYEVYPHKRVVTWSCKNYTSKVVTTKVPKTSCVLESITIDGGLSEPKECNCKEDTCKVKTTQLSCIQKNKDCQQQRKLMLQNHGQNSEIYRYFANFYNNIETMETRLEELSSLVDEKRLKKELLAVSLNRTANRLLVAEQEFKLSKRNLDAEEKILGKDLCVYKYFKDNQASLNYSIKELRLQSRLPIVDNIELFAITHQKSTGREKLISFLYDLNDPFSSLKAASKKMVYNLVCGNTRRRRSVEVDNDITLPFKSWDTSDNSTIAEKSCMTFRIITEFLATFVSNLNTLVEKVIQIERMVNITAYKLESFANNISVHQNHMNNLLRQEMQNIENRSSIPHVYQAWKQIAEIYTAGNNFSLCLNFKDCIDTAFDSLTSLLILVPENRDAYKTLLDNMKNNWIVLENFVNNTYTLLELSNKIKSFQNSLGAFRHGTIMCSSKPNISEPKTTVHNVQSNSVLNLACGDIESGLPVKYHWKLHDKYLDGENSDSISFIASIDKSGVYTCVVSSAVGQSSTSGILVNVYEKPEMISQPDDVYFVLPNQETNATILCEVNGHPKPNISWYYMNYQNQEEALLSIDGPELSLDVSLNSTEGFYLCKAANDYGEVQSNHARVDILKTELPSQYIEMSVNIVQPSNSNDMQPSINISLSDFPANFMNIFNSSQEQSTFLSLIKKDDVNSLHFKVEAVYPSNTTNASSMIDLMLISKKSREVLAIRAAKFGSWAVSNRSEIHLAGPNLTLKADNNSITYRATLNKCQPGSHIHSNGIVCVQCKAGFYGRNGNETCKQCPKGFYTPYRGSIECLKCKDEKTTPSLGSTSKRQCMDDAKPNLVTAKDNESENIVYAIIGIALLLVVIIIVIVCYRCSKKLSHNEKKNDKVVMINPTTDDPTFFNIDTNAEDNEEKNTYEDSPYRETSADECCIKKANVSKTSNRQRVENIYDESPRHCSVPDVVTMPEKKPGLSTKNDRQRVENIYDKYPVNHSSTQIVSLPKEPNIFNENEDVYEALAHTSSDVENIYPECGPGASKHSHNNDIQGGRNCEELDRSNRFKTTGVLAHQLGYKGNSNDEKANSSFEKELKGALKSKRTLQFNNPVYEEA